MSGESEGDAVVVFVILVEGVVGRRGVHHEIIEAGICRNREGRFVYEKIFFFGGIL